MPEMCKINAAKTSNVKLEHKNDHETKIYCQFKVLLAVKNLKSWKCSWLGHNTPAVIYLEQEKPCRFANCSSACQCI